MANRNGDRGARAEIEQLARPLDTADDLEPLIRAVGDARFVLLGEASHGTADFYRLRAELTRRLIEEQGFSFVAVEGDWPDCFEVNRWVKGLDEKPATAHEVLDGFDRWPTWMWANDEVADFVDWLRHHNATTGADAGFYGLDVYSLWDSLRGVIEYLEEHDAGALAPAMRAYACFEPYGEDPQEYAWATRMVPQSCEQDVVDLLVDMRERAVSAGTDQESELDARQNAEVVAEAERYYRAMVRGDGNSWNVRDCHMVDTLDRLVAHHGSESRAVVWAHNTHVGDARATPMSRAGMVNVGQVTRERHADEGVFLVGFGGHRGQVIAADAWGAPMRRMDVPPAAEGTHEDLLFEVLGRPALFVFPDERDGPWLSARRGHRAIGVVYDPGNDRIGNWVPTVMGRRYDAFCSFDEIEALHPLHREVAQLTEEQETYPFGR